MKFCRSVCLLLFVLPLLFADWKDRVASLQKQGVIVDNAKIESLYPQVKDEDNAAFIVQKASSLYQDFSLDDLPTQNGVSIEIHELSLTTPLSDQNKSKLRKYIEANKASLEILYQIIPLNKSRYPIKLSDGFNAQLPHLNDINNFSELLQWEAIFHIDNQDAEKAIRAIRCNQKLINTVLREPLLISYLVGIFRTSDLVYVCRYLLNRLSLNKNQLADLESIVEGFEHENSWTRSMQMELCYGVSVFESVDTGQLDKIDENIKSNFVTKSAISVYKATGKMDKDFSLYADTILQMIMANKLPLQRSIPLIQNLEKKMVDAAGNKLFISSFVMPGVEMNFFNHLFFRANLDVMRIAFAVAKYRLNNNALPKSINELVPDYLPEVYMDIDGKDVRYQSLKQGFVVYSVGKDRKDDYSVHKDQTLPRQDTVFEVLR